MGSGVWGQIHLASLWHEGEWEDWEAGKLLGSYSGNLVRSALQTFAPLCIHSLSKHLLSGHHLDLTWCWI